MWVILQSQYEGTGAVLNFNAIETYTKIKYEDYTNLEQFIIGFKKAIEKLANLEISPPDAWHPILFIIALSDAWPIWAERQRSNTRSEATKLTLSALIEDITDEARKKDKKADGSIHYNGKPPTKGKPNSKFKDSAKGKSGKMCKNCENPNARHEPENCLVTNKKLRQEWEQRTGKKFTPFNASSNKLSKKLKKAKNDNSSDEEDEHRQFSKNAASYFCVQLDYSRSPIQNGTLFDTRAETHIASSIEEFDNGTYKTSQTLPSIDTASGITKPLGQGERTLQCITDNGNIHTLHLTKVQYLPNYGMNIFGARKLLGRGELHIPDKNLVVNKKGIPMFRFDENMMN
jgi:hypothetical protein